MKVGDIVRLSKIGLAEQWWPSNRTPAPERRRGTVVRIVRTGRVYVRWDRWKTPQVYNPNHMEGLEVVKS